MDKVFEVIADLSRDGGYFIFACIHRPISEIITMQNWKSSDKEILSILIASFLLGRRQEVCLLLTTRRD